MMFGSRHICLLFAPSKFLYSLHQNIILILLQTVFLKWCFMKTASLQHLLGQGCTSPGRQLSVASKFSMLAHKICESSV
jgi:hypothetical protein